jgi:hypothetical protein
MSTCEQESTISAALQNGELTEGLGLHVEGCAVCSEVDSAFRRMRLMADNVGEESRPSAASMWWRLNLRMRQDKTVRAQAPLIWMARIAYAAIALMAVLLLTMIPDFSRPVIEIGLAGIAAVALPVAITLWSWSRSRS